MLTTRSNKISQTWTSTTPDVTIRDHRNNCLSLTYVYNLHEQHLREYFSIAAFIVFLFFSSYFSLIFLPFIVEIHGEAWNNVIFKRRHSIFPSFRSVWSMATSQRVFFTQRCRLNYWPFVSEPWLKPKEDVPRKNFLLFHIFLFSSLFLNFISNVGMPAVRSKSHVYFSAIISLSFGSFRYEFLIRFRFSIHFRFLSFRCFER